MRFRVLALLGALMFAAAALAPATGSASGTSGPCGQLKGVGSYDHVVVIMDENVAYSTLRDSAQAPYLHTLGSQCGTETNMHAATHPSQPNYMAATSGHATGSGAYTVNDNVFHQAQVVGDRWAAYQESMPSACSGSRSPYLKGHNPPFCYTDLASPKNTCALYDVPSSPALDDAIYHDSLPALSWVTPDACHDMHWVQGCSQPYSKRISAGDTWLSRLVPRLTALPSYAAGKTLVLITWDEGDGASTDGVDCTRSSVYTSQPSCDIPTIVVSPYVVPGTVDHADRNLYGLLGDVEDILGYPRLGRAVGQSSPRPGLGF